jgi:hypothetical protein
MENLLLHGHLHLLHEIHQIDITKFGGIPPVMNALSEANSQADSSYRKAKVNQQLASEAAEAKALEEGRLGVKDAIVKTKK